MAARQCEEEEEGELFPILPVERKALQAFAPQLAHVGNVKLISNRRGIVISVEDIVAIKYGHALLEREAENIQFVSQHFPCIPIANVHGVYKHDDGSRYLVMDYINGTPLLTALPMMSRKQKEKLFERLRGIFDMLRSRDASYVGSTQKGPAAFDFAVSDRGPYESVKEFNDVIVYKCEQHTNFHRDITRSMLSDRGKIVFSHGDVSLRNIIIHDGELAAVIDWEYAGFYPEYWEYTVAGAGIVWRIPGLDDWLLYLQRCLLVFPMEAAAFRTMRFFTVTGEMV